MLKVQFVLKKKVCQLSVHQRVDVLQAFLVNDTRRKIYSKNTLRSQRVKGIVHPKMKIPSSFTHPQVVPNLNKFLSSAEHKGIYFEECL